MPLTSVLTVYKKEKLHMIWSNDLKITSIAIIKTYHKKRLALITYEIAAISHIRKDSKFVTLGKPRFEISFSDLQRFRFLLTISNNYLHYIIRPRDSDYLRIF